MRLCTQGMTSASPSPFHAEKLIACRIQICERQQMGRTCTLSEVNQDSHARATLQGLLHMQALVLHRVSRIQGVLHACVRVVESPIAMVMTPHKKHPKAMMCVLSSRSPSSPPERHTQQILASLQHNIAKQNGRTIEHLASHAIQGRPEMGFTRCANMQRACKRPRIYRAG